jgi:ATP-dependent DNA helicase Q1
MVPVNAVALTGSMPAAERKDIEKQLIALASGSSQDEIKLCYVTVGDYLRILLS